MDIKIVVLIIDGTDYMILRLIRCCDNNLMLISDLYLLKSPYKQSHQAHNSNTQTHNIW